MINPNPCYLPNFRRAWFIGFVCAGLCLALLSGAEAGVETGGGGTLVEIAGGYQVADAFFQPTPFKPYRMSDEIYARLKGLATFLTLDCKIDFKRGDGRTFWGDILDPAVDVRLVERLPHEISFIPKENLPSSLKRRDIGATVNGITYLRSDFAELPDQQFNAVEKTLFLIHERLFAFAPEAPLENRVALVKAFRVLLEKYLPARDRLQKNPDLDGTDFYFTHDELITLNSMSSLIVEVMGQRRAQDRPIAVQFTQDGGLLLELRAARPAARWEIDPSTRVHLGSTITQAVLVKRSYLEPSLSEIDLAGEGTGMGYRPEPPEAGVITIEGKDSDLIRSTVWLATSAGGALFDGATLDRSHIRVSAGSRLELHRGVAVRRMKQLNVDGELKLSLASNRPSQGSDRRILRVFHKPNSSIPRPAEVSFP